MSAKSVAASRRKRLLRIVDEYIDETGIHDVDLNDVAAWALKTNRVSQSRYDPVKQLRREMQRVSRQDYVEDDNGQPVRRRHSYKIKNGEVQHTLWAKIEEITPRKMRMSAQGRRRSILADVLQLKRDLAFYNLKYNPGDPIQPSFNFDPDSAESELPTEYIDTPPSEDEEDDGSGR
jgi:hypothetical protein